ncbi:hypothetical protein Vadar_016914 [Vaccinium darrowii]|uniref:Uncharacterized protein n=1 Tax=Vaccinium darrowii TaxID=229202 RepID=A0ACB7Y131_9ERIC|nr:hypothetical protein Vadar_016914 [Vaccinium darrowii]
MFIQYLDNYVAQLNINPLYSRSVQWQMVVWNVGSGETEEFEGGCFLWWQWVRVVKGSKGVGVIGFLRESCTFKCEYDNGNRCSGKDVLEVGCGNSCTENAYNLCNYGARAAISVRSPVYFFPPYLHNVHFMW